VNREQVKRILLAHRPGARPDGDLETEEALAVAQHDPELRSWLEQQHAFHDALRAELRSIPVPPGLKSSILAQDKVIAMPIWRGPWFLLAAACLALTLIISGLWIVQRSSEDLTFDGFRSRMVGSALREYRMDILSSNEKQIQKFLQASNAPANYVFTKGLQSMPLKGARAMQWQNHPVSMICFALPKGETLYMFVMDQAALREGKLPQASPEIEPTQGIVTASWSQDGKVYLIAASDRAELEKSLAN
jgi:hypothetical protein